MKNSWLTFTCHCITLDYYIQVYVKTIHLYSSKIQMLCFCLVCVICLHVLVHIFQDSFRGLVLKWSKVPCMYSQIFIKGAWCSNGPKCHTCIRYLQGQSSAEMVQSVILVFQDVYRGGLVLKVPGFKSQCLKCHTFIPGCLQRRPGGQSTRLQIAVSCHLGLKKYVNLLASGHCMTTSI